ncbi:MAG: NADH-quinone oxidoreductase subunit L [Thermoplasmatales archaeon]|nr:NADH-quinone oxidoreductase subunit L [Thermoplasmatales archaeon]MCW6169684.1 NADH-quinone oxidoreductase subunit L [Thermoplasmatales archaeon]
MSATIYWYGWLIVISPLVGFLASYIAGRKYRITAGIIASTAIGLSLVFSILTLLKINSSGQPIYNHFKWFFNIDAGIYIDHLAIIMALMVSFVSLMIHLFAIYYMKDDPNKHTYFAETSLFTAGMLGLIVASNLVLFFLFWELVGLCSYLLIGFWFFKPNATAAAKKAFIVTRVGDLLFLVGMAILYASLSAHISVLGANSPLSIPYLITNAKAIATAIGPTTLGIVSVLFLAGAAGKSAQFPLHVWIPDAMEGPTTVSALIHAATMVTAGVYLVARVFPIFYASSSFALYSVAILGSFTAIYAGILGLVMNDIKRVLAYSTISQIGYMMAAIGLAGIIGYSGVAYGIFQLVTHAFFKALLFVSTGAILIALLELRDIKKMGGLWKRMPMTVTLLLIGAAALIAFPGTSGYFSKDTIISASYVYYLHGGNIASMLPWLFLLLGSLLTTLYTFRMFFLVAMGKPRSDLAEHAKDPKLLPLIPLFFLAAGALFLGIVQPQFYGFLYPSYIMPSLPYYIQYLPEVLMVIGLVVTYFLYGTDRWKKLHFDNSPWYKVVRNKFYLDTLFTNIIAERVIAPVSAGFGAFESAYNKAIDSIGTGTIGLGSRMRKLQNGIVENYFVIILIGMSIILLIMILEGVL